MVSAQIESQKLKAVRRRLVFHIQYKYYTSYLESSNTRSHTHTHTTLAINIEPPEASHPQTCYYALKGKQLPNTARDVRLSLSPSRSRLSFSYPSFQTRLHWKNIPLVLARTISTSRIVSNRADRGHLHPQNGSRPFRQLSLTRRNPSDVSPWAHWHTYGQEGTGAS